MAERLTHHSSAPVHEDPAAWVRCCAKCMELVSMHGLQVTGVAPAATMVLFAAQRPGHLPTPPSFLDHFSSALASACFCYLYLMVSDKESALLASACPGPDPTSPTPAVGLPPHRPTNLHSPNRQHHSQGQQHINHTPNAAFANWNAMVGPTIFLCQKKSGAPSTPRSGHCHQQESPRSMWVAIYWFRNYQIHWH